MHSRVAGSVARLALVPGILFFAPAVAIANEETVSAQIEALRQVVERQQAQLDIQQRQLEAQRAELDALKVGATGSTPAADTDHKRLEELERSASTAKVAAQEAPTVRMVGNRPTIASADGRSTLSLRSNVQLDFGHYDQSSRRATGHRLPSRLGRHGQRENDAARDLSDGAYFRRARFGVEGIIARDFSYRLLFEFGGSGTEGPARINDAYIAYTGFAPFTFQLGAFSPPANLADGTPTEDLMFIERATSAELSRALGAADGRLGIGLRTGGSRWLGALTLTSRTVNDAEVFDSQNAVVGRLGGLVASTPDWNVHVGRQRDVRVRAGADGADRNVRLRDPLPGQAGDSASTAHDSSTPAAWSPTVLSPPASSSARTGRTSCCKVKISGTASIARESSQPDPGFGGYYIEASWIPTGESRRYVPTQRRLPRAPTADPFRRARWLGRVGTGAALQQYGPRLSRRPCGDRCADRQRTRGRTIDMGGGRQLVPEHELQAHVQLLARRRGSTKPCGPGQSDTFRGVAGHATVRCRGRSNP